MFNHVKCLFMVFGLVMALLLGASQLVLAAASDAVRAELRGYIENVTQANAYRYAAKDSAGHTMDCVKIIANPYVGGQFLGVYHSYTGSLCNVFLATSTDLMNWTYVKTLAGANGANASQPAIKAAYGGGFIVAWEQEPNNHVKVAYYSSWANLQNGAISKSYDCPRQLSVYAEGTPNIYEGSSTNVDIGFHYYMNGDVDRQARGTLTNFNSWSSSAQPSLDNAMLYWGVHGNIGDRDGKVHFKGYDFNLQEGQFIKGDFGSWRCFLYDWQTGNADQLSIRTHGGSTAFANPTCTLINIGGKNAVLVTQFLPSEGAASGESGELIYYRYFSYSSGLPKTYEAEGSQLRHTIGRVDGDGWSANTVQDAPGHMIYGPYATDIPTGSRVATFRLMVDVNNTVDENVVNLDIYDSTSGIVLAQQTITRKKFNVNYLYQDFNLGFNNATAGHSLEFRVYWYDKAYIKVDKITIY